MLVEDGIILLKYWFSVSDEEQEKRFISRADDPMRRWKLSPNDVLSITKWEDYSRAKDTMFVHTDIPEARWWEVDTDDKRRGRINTIAHLLSQVPYELVEREEIVIPPRPPSGGYERPPRDMTRTFPTTPPRWSSATRRSASRATRASATRRRTPSKIADRKRQKKSA